MGKQMTPSQFISWYKRQDLEFIVVGRDKQEINHDTDLWKGFSVYVHLYSIGDKYYDYYDVRKNRLNPDCLLFSVRPRILSLRKSARAYELFESALLLNRIDTSVELRSLRPYIRLINEKIDELLEYMNAVDGIRSQVVRSLRLAEWTVWGTHEEGILWWKKTVRNTVPCSKWERDSKRIKPLTSLLAAIDDPEWEPFISPALFAERYRAIMTGKAE